MYFWINNDFLPWESSRYYLCLIPHATWNQFFDVGKKSISNNASMIFVFFDTASTWIERFQRKNFIEGGWISFMRHLLSIFLKMQLSTFIVGRRPKTRKRESRTSSSSKKHWRLLLLLSQEISKSNEIRCTF